METRWIAAIGAVIVLLALLSPGVLSRSLTVTATAYNATVAQTDSTPAIGACNRARPLGVNVMAVSPDLMKLGLDCGTRVEVEGVGDFVVWDRMDEHWVRRIDILMGRDVGNAAQWGARVVRINW